MNCNNYLPIVLNVGVAARYADWNWKHVCSPFARIYYVITGEATVTLRGQRYRLLPGRMYLIPPFATHDTECKGTFQHYYIHVYEEESLGDGLFDTLELPFEIQPLKGDDLLFARLVSLNPTMQLEHFNPAEYDNREMLVQSLLQNKQRPDWLKMESRGILLQILSRFAMGATTKLFGRDERVQKSIRTIHSRLNESISIPALAAEMQVSTGYFIRQFRRVTGVSPKLYINQKRVEKAQLYLLTTTLSIKEIAQGLGYDDNSYFTRIFRNITGFTPNEYRKQFNQIS